MRKATIRVSIGLFSLIVLSACATSGKRQTAGAEPCPPPATVTCDRFAGENYNCSCERGSNLRDILDAY